MQIVHYQKTDHGVEDSTPVKAASVLSILFDSVMYDAGATSEIQRDVIDLFFAQVSFAADSALVEEISLGELMSVVDRDSRWVYSGSLTTPPCSQKNVRWNILSKVYPIGPEIVHIFRNRLKKSKADNFM